MSVDATLAELDACASPGNSDEPEPAESHEVIEGLKLNLTAIDIGGCDPADEEGDINIFWEPEAERDVGRWLKVFVLTAPIHAMERDQKPVSSPFFADVRSYHHH
jgi:hypothetical protein